MIFRKQKMLTLLKNIRKNSSGATLENYTPINHRSGYQYSITENSEENATSNIYKALEMIKALQGNCGLWFDNGLFYVETSYYTNDFNEAMQLACRHNQKTIYDWRHDTYITCDPKMTFLKYTGGAM